MFKSPKWAPPQITRSIKYHELYAPGELEALNLAQKQYDKHKKETDRAINEEYTKLLKSLEDSQKKAERTLARANKDLKEIQSNTAKGIDTPTEILTVLLTFYIAYERRTKEDRGVPVQLLELFNNQKRINDVKAWRRRALLKKEKARSRRNKTKTVVESESEDELEVEEKKPTKENFRENEDFLYLMSGGTTRK
ncbi:hypothetical protein AKO1_006240 [Acrasis kona]|uniref:Uncharacterized protein n=1 Tax=Acrasis kona TaxID=1008807 RepID=A0AAW2YJF1_9EUKA